MIMSIDKVKVSDDDKIKFVDKIIDMIPEIKDKRNFIIDKILTKSDSNNDYILEKIIVNNKYYYKDKYKCIFDNSINLVGIWDWNHDNNKFNYYIFTEESNHIINASTSNKFSLFLDNK